MILDSIVWLVGAAGYYFSLILWIIAQRTHHLHGKYSHSWMVGTLLLIFGAMQLVSSMSTPWIASIGAISLIMPAIVTTMDVEDHLRDGRGLLEHKSHCWMESELVKRREHHLVQSSVSHE